MMILGMPIRILGMQNIFGKFLGVVFFGILKNNNFRFFFISKHRNAVGVFKKFSYDIKGNFYHYIILILINYVKKCCIYKVAHVLNQLSTT